MTEDETAGGRIALIGFGEAARAFASGWGKMVAGRVAAFDIKTGDIEAAPAMHAAMQMAGVAGKASAAEALAAADMAICVVTADQAVAAAEAGAPHLAPGTFWFDCNSCAPGSKVAAARAIVAGGGRYVDVAVMAPVQPLRHRVPLLISGPDAEPGESLLASLGMQARAVGDKVGQASSIKMLRSVMIKGIEALTAECLLAARRAGVDEDVLASLQASDPGFDWAARSAYNLERMAIHGLRRAAEMREVALTLRELGLPDRMAAATIDWQETIGKLGLALKDEALAARADMVLSALAGRA